MKLGGNLDQPAPEDKERIEAKKTMEGWAQKMQGVGGQEASVNLSADKTILEVNFKGGPYIRVVYGEQGHLFSVYHLGSKQEFFDLPHNNYESVGAKTTEELEEYFSQSMEAIKRGEWPSRPSVE